MRVKSAALSKAIACAATLKREDRGVAAIEFAIFVGMLSLALLNAADIGVYIYQRMEVENATEMGVQAVWKNCDFSQLPATTSCPAMSAAVKRAVQSTSLGTKVTLQAGSPAEGYYCVNTSNALQYMSDISSKPADCTAAGTPTLQPGDYIQIGTTYSYAPMFPGITVASAFTTPILRTALMRLE